MKTYLIIVSTLLVAVLVLIVLMTAFHVQVSLPEKTTYHMTAQYGIQVKPEIIIPKAPQEKCKWVGNSCIVIQP